MTTYATVITPELRRTNAHLSSATIRTDLRDTEEEIENLRHCETAWTLLSEHAVELGQRRLYELKRLGAPNQRADRQRFIDYLTLLLTDRGETR